MGARDQFSLAVIAYEMLTGEKPYTGEHLTTVVYKIVAEEPHRSASPESEPERGHRSGPAQGAGQEAGRTLPHLQEFAGALEKACAATKNWKAMPRGGSLNEPTMADVPRPPVMLPPKRRPHSVTTATMEKPPKKSGFLPFLMAVLVAAALLALIGWQAAPFLTASRQAPQTATSQAAQPAAVTPPSTPPSPAPEPAQTEQSPAGSPPDPAATQASAPPVNPAPASPAPSDPADAKPKPMPPAEPKWDSTRNVAAKSNAPPAAQEVAIISSPAGATVTMDDRADAVCHTPCRLDAASGAPSDHIRASGLRCGAPRI